MPKFKSKAITALMVGLLVCVLCALFPPRRVFQGARLASRGFLFSPNVNVERGQPTYSETYIDGKSIGKSTTPYYPSTYVEIDTGRLLGEFIVIISVSGIIALYLLRKHLEWVNDQS
jgi:hypothetical protein